ncbi:hypothetical protein F5148DRAFT_122579 [Russula earlei]|uniref:Uncharacterized protein n=1 Tax=Russula earlei TaxID=71964 RepID=A0ACC0UJW6_9AGAM|nr:hypothetical protein F5148DRAFT_122579 [Russula earlei]
MELKTSAWWVLASVFPLAPDLANYPMTHPSNKARQSASKRGSGRPSKLVVSPLANCSSDNDLVSSGRPGPECDSFTCARHDYGSNKCQASYLPVSRIRSDSRKSLSFMGAHINFRAQGDDQTQQLSGLLDTYRTRIGVH